MVNLVELGLGIKLVILIKFKNFLWLSYCCCCIIFFFIMVVWAVGLLKENSFNCKNK